YVHAQIGMLRDLEVITGQKTPDADDRGLSFLRRLDQKLAAQHPDDLAYPAELLAHALVHALRGLDVDRAIKTAFSSRPDTALRPVVAQYLVRLAKKPPLRSGVARTFSFLHAQAIPIIVVTEDRQARCEELLSHHRLSLQVLTVISARKSRELYLDLRQRH